MNYSFIAVVTLALASAASASAKDIRVPSGKIHTIQQGIDAAAPGDTVLVMPGTYSDPSVGQWWPPIAFVPQERAGLKLRAVGAPGAVKIVGSGIGVAMIVSGANVSVEGFEISGFTEGISAGGASGIHLSRNFIHDCSSDCMTLSGALNCEVDHNTVLGGIHGIFLNGWPGAGPNTGHSLHHNIIKGSGDGVFLWNSPNCSIEHNEIDNTTSTGIYLANSGSSTVGENQANDGQVGIALGNSPGCEVKANEANRNSAWGLAVINSCATAFSHNAAFGNGEYDFFAPPWDNSDPLCNIYTGNRGITAYPSPAVWDIRTE